ncbi:MAG: hypothetical protein SGARI_002734 [Bacillariaceae sp.]
MKSKSVFKGQPPVNGSAFYPFDTSRQDAAMHPGPPAISASSSSSIFLEKPKKRAKETSPRNKKIQWEQFEHEIILRMVKEAAGTKPDWTAIKNQVNKQRAEKQFQDKRTGKQCRARWCDQLDPDIIKGCWSKEEEGMLLYYHEMFGPKWSSISKLMKGRTQNDIKNKYNSMVRTAKIQHKKDPSQSFASLMQLNRRKPKMQYVAEPQMQLPFVPELPSIQGVVSQSSSSDSDNSAYSYQQGARFDQAQVLYSGNSIPQYSFDSSTTSELPQAGMEPLDTGGDNAHTLPEYKPSPWADLDFSF